MSSKAIEKLEEAKKTITIIQAKLVKALTYQDPKMKDQYIHEALVLLGGNYGKKG